MRIALAVIAALGAILLFLLATASSNTALFADNYPLLLGINAVAALALLVLVGFQLRALRREYRAGRFGSRLKSRLVLMLVVMAVVPGVVVYGVSVQFAVRSIDSWFDVRVDSALEGGLELGRNVIDTLQADLLAKARDMAYELSDADAPGPAQLNRLREQTGVETATLMTVAGHVLANSTNAVSGLLPEVPTAAHLRQVRQTRGVSSIEGEPATGLTLKALVPVGGFSSDALVLQLSQAVPESIARSAESVEAAHRDYQGLQLARNGLKSIYTLTLTFALLVALFAAVSLAFFLAERLARPLLILAEGTRAVAAGDFTPRTELPSSDELGVLTQSFNAMTRQLDEARSEAERQRAYLESVLANLSAGVLVFDAGFTLTAANRGAFTILGDELVDLSGMPLHSWPRHQALAQAIVEGFRDRGGEWQRQLEIGVPDGSTQTLLLRGSTLPDAAGYVSVFDDITQLISAQRSIAWGEVARRLAHEIKNPLTPIQLSAERLEKKLAESLDDPGREILRRSTATIVNQVEAMKHMVNSFRDYARMPPPMPAALDLNELVREMLQLYEADTVAVRADLVADLTPVFADGSQLRQVLHNLIKNAREALVDHPPADGEPSIVVSTRQEQRRGILVVSDNGPGFDPQMLARACEPYATSKAKGTGLGLAIVRKIVDEHNGELRIANRSGGGSEVTIWLPLAAQD